MNSRFALPCSLVAWLVLAPLAGVVTAGSMPEEAESLFDAVEKSLSTRSATNQEIIRALDLSTAACRDLELPADPEISTRLEARVRRTESRLLLQALALEDVDRKSKTNKRHAVQMRAAALLAGASMDTAPKLMALLHRKLLKNNDYVRHPLFYARVLRAAASLNSESAFEFILTRGVNADTNTESAKRARAAIETLADMPLSGEQRRQVVRRLIVITKPSQLRHHAALGWAYWYAASANAEKALRVVLLDKQRPDLERATALLALGRMAQPHGKQVLRHFAHEFNAYAGAGLTLRGLARYGDTTFLY